MPSSRKTSHVYGGADDENHQPPGEEGLRGEQGSPLVLRHDLTRSVTGTKEPITVEEQSGTAFVETREDEGGLRDEPAPDA